MIPLLTPELTCGEIETAFNTYRQKIPASLKSGNYGSEVIHEENKEEYHVYNEQSS